MVVACGERNVRRFKRSQYAHGSPRTGTLGRICQQVNGVIARKGHGLGPLRRELAIPLDKALAHWRQACVPRSTPAHDGVGAVWHALPEQGTVKRAAPGNQERSL